MNKWDAKHYQEEHAFVFEYGQDVLELLEIQKGQRVLDLGCGTGQLTQQISRLGASVVGVDQSREMLSFAKKSYPNIDFIQKNILELSFREEFDAVFSNAVFHWIEKSRQQDAAKRIADALKPGGRLATEFGGHGNNQGTIDVMLGVLARYGIKESVNLYFPTVGEYASVLERAGIEVQYAALFDRPTKLSGGEDGMKNWIGMFHQRLFESLPPALRTQAMGEILDELRENGFFWDGAWYSDYRRIRIAAKKR